MKSNKELRLDVQLMPRLESSIHRWLTARATYKAQSSVEQQHEYTATLFDLGAAWGEHYPDAVDTPGAFELYRHGLIAPEEE
jgi:hypothetical protein